MKPLIAWKPNELRFLAANEPGLLHVLEASETAVLLKLRRGADYQIWELRRRIGGYLQFSGNFTTEEEARRAWARETGGGNGH